MRQQNAAVYFDALAVLGYGAIILTHILGKYYVRTTPLTLDWLAANLLDGLLRPGVGILEMATGYCILRLRKPSKWEWGAVLSFYKKRAVEWWLPVLAMIALILLYWGSYDKKPVSYVSSILNFAEVLKTPAYPFWLGLVIIVFDLAAPALWFLETATKRLGVHLLALSWLLLILAPSILGKGPRTDSLFAKHIGYLLIGGYYICPISKWAATHIDKQNRIRAIFFMSMIITLSIPFYEHFSEIDPWYPHSLRDYTRFYVFLYTLAAAILAFMFFEAHKKYAMTLLKLLPLCFPAYLMHSWIIECGIYWSFGIPVLGLVVKVAIVAFIILLWAKLCLYVQADFKNSLAMTGKEPHSA
jgi:hypothetical protein